MLWSLTPHELRMMVDEKAEREKREEALRWVRMGWMVMQLIQPHTKRKLRLDQFVSKKTLAAAGMGKAPPEKPTLNPDVSPADEFKQITTEMES